MCEKLNNLGWLTRQTGRFHTIRNPNPDIVGGLVKLDSGTTKGERGKPVIIFKGVRPVLTLPDR